MEKGTTLSVLDHGYCRYIDNFGTDQRILEAARISYKSPSKGDEQDKKLLQFLYKNAHCYHPQMEVLTADGWKKWIECNEYENFIIPNPNNKTLNIELLKVNKFQYADELYCFKNARMSYKVTADHRMWFKTRTGINKDSYQIYKASEMNKWGHYENITDYKFQNLPLKSSLEYELIGFYLGDGSKRSTNTIAFHLQRERKKVYLEQLLTNLGITFNKRPDTKKEDTYTYSFDVPLFFNIDLDLTAAFKRFDIPINNLSFEQKLGLFNGLISSDGSLKKDRKQIEFSSTSIHLIKLFEALAVYFGMDAHRCVTPRMGVFSTKAYKPERLSLESRHQYYYKEFYEGDVFCTTSSTGLLIVRGSSEDFSFVCGNSSPFEQVNITYNIKMPIFVMREFVRHRTFRLNEMSARYTQLPAEFYMPAEWRKQDAKNKQGSVGGEAFDPAWLAFNENGLPVSCSATQALKAHCDRSYALYEKMLREGVARELARMVLPINIYTEIYVNCDVRNLMHFFNLRLAPTAQFEIRQVAKAMFEIFEELYPWSAEAFKKFKFKMVEEM